MEKRIERLRAFASTHDFSLFGEEKSGIPMGQPILVGHHSERRHRRHLERLNRLVQKGYDAGKRADQLESRLHGMRSNNQIQVDNPDAPELLEKRIQELEGQQKRNKELNRMVRACKGDVVVLAAALAKSSFDIKDPEKLAANLLAPDFAGRIGIPGYVMSNLSANIRRLKERRGSVALVQQGFEPFTVGDIGVEFVDGQIQLVIGYKPSEESRGKLKRLAFKWSRYSERWVRKHTATTASKWFKSELTVVLKETKP